MNAHEHLAAMNAGDINGANAIVVVRRPDGEAANKIFELAPDGTPTKAAAANASAYVGMQIDVPDQEAMVSVLRAVGGDPQACLVLGRLKDAPTGLFDILSAKLMTSRGGATWGWQTLPHGRAICRSKGNMQPSSWLLIDRDFTDCQPPEMTFHDVDEWWAAMTRIAPGLEGVGRIDLPSSSSRLLDADGQEVFTSPSSHHYIQLADADDLYRLGSALLMRALRVGLGWRRMWGGKPSRSWTIYDPTTFSWERLSFDGAPSTKIEGTSIAPPDVRIGVEGGAFDSSTVPMPGDEERTALAKDHGLRVATHDGKIASLEDVTSLTLATEITVQDGTHTVSELWLRLSAVGGDLKLRAQAPFRTSSSWAALVRLDKAGVLFVYDVGTHTKFRLAVDERVGPPLDEFFARLSEADDQSRWIKATARAIGRHDAAGVETGDALARLVELSEGSLAGMGSDRRKFIKAWVHEACTRATARTALEQSGLPTVAEAVAKMNRRYGVAMFGTKTVVVTEVQSEIDHWMPKFINPEELKKYMSNAYAVSPATGKQVSVYTAWMQSEDRNTFDGVVFRPEVSFRSGPREIAQGGLYNAWQGFTVTPQEGAVEALDLVLDHIFDVFADRDQVKYDYLIDWMAAALQNPERQDLPVPVLKSAEGVGKGIVIDGLLLSLFGVHGYVVSKHTDFSGRFNGHLGLNVFVSLNEAVWGGNKSEAGQYKAMLTDQYRSVEYKHKDAIMVPNYTKAIISTNEEWFAPVGLQDRRHVVFDCSAIHKDDRGYFTNLAKAVGECRGAFLCMMLNHQVNYDAMRKPPKWVSTAAERAVFMSADSVTAWMYDFLNTGGVPRVAGYTRPSFAPGEVVKKSDVHASYVDWTKAHTRETPRPPSVFWRKCRELVGDTAHSYRTRVPKEGAATLEQAQRSVVAFASLDDMRDAFQENIGQPIMWDGDDDE